MKNNDYSRWMGFRLAYLRERAGVAMSDVAAELGYKSKSSIQYIESGRSLPRMQDLPVLARLYGTSVSFLLEGQLHHDVSQMEDYTGLCTKRFHAGTVCSLKPGHFGACRGES